MRVYRDEDADTDRQKRAANNRMPKVSRVARAPLSPLLNGLEGALDFRLNQKACSPSQKPASEPLTDCLFTLPATRRTR